MLLNGRICIMYAADHDQYFLVYEVSDVTYRRDARKKKCRLKVAKPKSNCSSRITNPQDGLWSVVSSV
jgi:hypothetical protein